eukprot:TRINITY_DN12525_c0_g1_i2.p1 TRINITY_DN12525_c0_g1~~TRINITY_DN12525_c0_g1_i2.p1  ORF type:complete len:577 (+),score=123.76 TRINITY_DN12525_c0_g1_i2:249-1733(+)
MEDVREMTLQYMKQTRTLILAVVATGDLQTSEILQLAKDVDPEFTRTIVVISKPDLMEKFTEETMLKQAEKMSFPYHVVRCRGKEERDRECTPNQMKIIEEAFFKKPPWCHVNPSFVGVEELQKRLSDLITCRIKEELPKVKNELNKKLDQTRRELIKLGLDCTDPLVRRREFERIRMQFVQLIRDTVTGCYTHSFFRKEEHRFFAMFRELREKFSDVILASNAKRTHFSKSDVVYTTKGWVNWEERRYYSLDILTPPHIVDMITRMKAYRGEELPCVMTWNILKGFILDTIETWKIPTITFTDQTCKSLAEVLELICETISAGHLRLREYFHKKTKELMKLVKSQINERVNDIFQWESNPTTENKSLAAEISNLRYKRILDRIPEHGKDQKENILKAVKEVFCENETIVATAFDLDLILNAYFSFAKGRFIDSVILSVIKEMKALGELSETILATEDELFELMGDDAMTKTKRERLNHVSETCQLALGEFGNR